MENLILTGNIVLPLFLLIAAGFALRRAGIVGESLSDGLNLLVFELFLPAMIFETIYETEVGGVFDAGLLGFSAVFTLAVTGLSMWIVPKLEPDDRKRGTLVQAIFRSNVVIFGLPLVNAILGEGNSGPTALLIAFMIPLFNILSVMVFAYYGGGKTDFRSFLRSCLKNPLMIACALGLLFPAASTRPPERAAQGVRS
ncbi:MAG TPA: AEC family transporter, partial [Oscillospiraceae bacterium]|nr:AEC family transporter [Oscillospiraceae bacterium]